MLRTNSLTLSFLAYLEIDGTWIDHAWIRGTGVDLKLADNGWASATVSALSGSLKMYLKSQLKRISSSSSSGSAELERSPSSRSESADSGFGCAGSFESFDSFFTREGVDPYRA